MRNVTILRTLAVGALVVALGGAALGAEMANSSSDGARSAAQSATVSVDLPSAAVDVIASLVGGTNPSTASHGHSDVTTTTSSTHADADEANETTDVDNDSGVHAGHELAPTGTSTTKPGF